MSSTKLAALYLHGNNENIPLYFGANIIQRQSGATFMSSPHCVIYVEAVTSNRFVLIRDFSLNGTWINNESHIKNATAIIQPNDILSFGSPTLTFILKRADIINID